MLYKANDRISILYPSEIFMVVKLFDKDMSKFTIEEAHITIIFRML